MKKLPLLTAAVAAGAVMIAPEAKACEDCTGGGAEAECVSGGSSGFGSCYIDEEYDECGEVIYTDCVVSYNAWCDSGSGSEWYGSMYFNEWACWAFTYQTNCNWRSGFAAE